MRQRRRNILKALAALLLVAVSAFAAVAVRDALAMGSPENVLPEMEVYHGDGKKADVLPAYHVRRDAYRWRFLFGDTEWRSPDLEVWREVQPGWVEPNTPLRIAFTFSPHSLRVYLYTPSAPGGPYVEQAEDLYSPVAPGEYTYRVDAGFGGGREVSYYFRVRVPQW